MRTEAVSQGRHDDVKLTRADREINLRGEVCPYTFVKSLLTLEEMEVGEVLRVILDYPQSVENVPRSLKNEGHEIVEVVQLNQRDWVVSIRKLAWDEGDRTNSGR